MKQFNMSLHEVLWEHSWVNLVMLTAPFFDDKKEDKTQGVDPMDLYNQFKQWQ